MKYKLVTAPEKVLCANLEACEGFEPVCMAWVNGSFAVLMKQTETPKPKEGNKQWKQVKKPRRW